MFQGFPGHHHRGFNISYSSGHRFAGCSSNLHNHGRFGLACIRVSLELLLVHSLGHALITIGFVGFSGPLCAMATECEPGVPILDTRLQQTTSV